jgi:hypothetical protein
MYNLGIKKVLSGGNKARVFHFEKALPLSPAGEGVLDGVVRVGARQRVLSLLTGIEFSRYPQS